MKKKFVIKWIDDNPNRKNVAKNLELRLNANVDFINVKNSNVEDLLVGVLSKRQPDLFIIDHIFDNAVTDVFKTGFTAAALIRSQWPTCPIVCVTAVDKDTFSSQSHSLYQETFEVANISSHDSEIMAIIKAFYSMRQNKPSTVQQICNALKVPKQDQIRLSSVLPHYVKEHMQDDAFAVNLCKWVRKTLLSRPGFLYDRLWVATLLGIKEESFRKVEQLFDVAKYSGLFSNDSEERWWKSGILLRLNELVNVKGLPWHIGRCLPGITARDFSKCYATEEDYPETVAFADESTDANRYAMRIKNTVAHPEYEDLLFFETIRMMKADE